MAQAPTDPAYGKRFIICCDGTGNNYRDLTKAMSNVPRLGRCVKRTDERARRYMQYWAYLPGIGSTTGSGVWTTLRNKSKGATGGGIEENVRAAHTFLSKHYGNASDAEIILVGFSRGALTARVLAALINDVGLLSEKGLRHHELIFTHWAARRQQWKDEPENDRLVVEAIRKRFAPDTFLFQDGRQIHIKAVAVWDTVQSLGWKQVFQNVLPWLATEGEEQRFAFVRNRLPSTVENAVQALALNEHRRNFQAVIWDAEGAASSLMKQCWFAGYHSDVGGGNGNWTNNVANISLVWMISQLTDTIQFDLNELQRLVEWTHSGYSPPRVMFEADEAPFVDSKTGIYKHAGDHHRSPGQHMHPMDTVHPGETVHWSVGGELAAKLLGGRPPILNTCTRVEGEAKYRVVGTEAQLDEEPVTALEREAVLWKGMALKQGESRNAPLPEWYGGSILPVEPIIIAPGSAAVEQGLELKSITVQEEGEMKKRIDEEKQERRTHFRNPNIPDGGRDDLSKQWRSLLPEN